MAYVIAEDNPTNKIAPSFPIVTIASIGAGLGLLFWGVCALVNYFVVDQLLCRSTNTLSACLDSTTLSGSISTIIIAVIGVAILVKFRIQQPLIVAVASGVVLWTLADWTDGLGWIEVALWSLVLYMVTYLLFTWIARYRKVIPVAIFSLVAVVIIRILLAA